MNLNSLPVVLLALLIFGSELSNSAVLDSNTSNSSMLARVIANVIVPVEIGIWSANNSFLLGLSGTVNLLVERDLSFHVSKRQTDTEKFPDSMRKPLLSSKSDTEFDAQKMILNKKLDLKQMEEVI